ncbi:CbiX/SirB N-terminal domain-containing protein [Candidatus Pyrohabitans sp.]
MSSGVLFPGRSPAMRKEKSAEAKTGVVIVGHGSRLKETRGIYETIASAVQTESGYETRVGYMKHHRPNLVEAVQSLIDEGYRRIVVVPLFIVPGLHVREDIPILLGKKEGELPEFGYSRINAPGDVEIIYADAIGADPRLAEVVLDRVASALNGKA